MAAQVLERLEAQAVSGQKRLAILLDPDKTDPQALPQWLRQAAASGLGYLFIGGSLLTHNRTAELVRAAKQATGLPAILFPGAIYQICAEADAVFFLSLISGRNPELLIGQHVHAAPVVYEMGLEAIPTGYMLVDCGRATSASYISGTLPIPHHKPDIAAATALAGRYLGLRVIYLDGGSGAPQPVSAEMITAVRKVFPGPLVVGGGIRTPEQAATAWQAGADVVVVGTALETSNSDSLAAGFARLAEAISLHSSR